MEGELAVVVVKDDPVPISNTSAPPSYFLTLASTTEASTDAFDSFPSLHSETEALFMALAECSVPQLSISGADTQCLLERQSRRKEEICQDE